jgi:hypothetical protein
LAWSFGRGRRRWALEADATVPPRLAGRHVIDRELGGCAPDSSCAVVFEGMGILHSVKGAPTPRASFVRERPSGFAPGVGAASRGGCVRSSGRAPATLCCAGKSARSRACGRVPRRAMRSPAGYARPARSAGSWIRCDDSACSRGHTGPGNSTMPSHCWRLRRHSAPARAPSLRKRASGTHEPPATA